MGLFAAHLNWTAPEDDGGVSDPLWDPAIDGKQNITTLTYTITLTSGKETTMVITQALSLIVSNLQHSTAYTVTVEAENVYGKGAEITTAFSTGKHLSDMCIYTLPKLNMCLVATYYSSGI